MLFFSLKIRYHRYKVHVDMYGFMENYWYLIFILNYCNYFLLHKRMYYYKIEYKFFNFRSLMSIKIFVLTSIYFNCQKLISEMFILILPYQNRLFYFLFYKWIRITGPNMACQIDQFQSGKFFMHLNSTPLGTLIRMPLESFDNDVGYTLSSLQIFKVGYLFGTWFALICFDI